jgi:predicted nucleic acid-binding protein
MEMARRNEIVLLLSDLLFQELEDAPREVMAIVEELPPESFVLVDTNDEAEFLQERYLEAGILGETWRDDALHVAIATVARADLIVSWNFKHIVQVVKIRRFNSVNMMHGYQAVDIRSPREVVSL